MKSDLELVWLVKAGNRDSFSELVKRHQRGLFRLLWRITREASQAEDILQETFIKAYQKINYFEERSSFKSWLFRIGINTANNLLRTRRNESYNVDDLMMSVGAQGERDLIYRDLQSLVRREIAKLPDRQRLALELRIFEDLSFQEIAEVMECPYDTAKANYRHALIKMRSTLEQSDWVKNLTELQDDSAIGLQDVHLEAEL